IAHVAKYGLADMEAKTPVEDDTIWRIFSMTKPITSVAAMMLYEQGALELTDPVSRYIPSFEDVRVWVGGSSVRAVTEPATEPVRIWHLLTHTSGLTYGFHYAHPVDAMYRAAGFDMGAEPDLDLAGCCDAWASLPLLFQPGSSWNYSVSTDVLGRVVEVASGQSLDEYFKTHIFDPLAMGDTAFSVKPEEASRLAQLYVPDATTGKAHSAGRFGAGALGRPRHFSGGGGLVSTAGDYVRFAEMLRGGGAVGDVRLLGPRTLDFMIQNHLPGNADIASFGTPINAEAPPVGLGFGLGFGVAIDPVASHALTGRGEYSWGGAASTGFFVDPGEDMTAVFMTQLLPSSTYPLRPQLRQLVYQAIVG
ncbi:MAG TPA: serine hydrolase domain-containing protein, partial [Acidimicrobiales bacterium]|nr:serine hydrolase domain-containing protein [Acidimicrobiales bacterium]